MTDTIRRPNRKLIRDFKKGLLKQDQRQSIYSVFAEYYDLIMEDIDYYSWYKYLLKIIRKFGLKVKTVLDMACGTGGTLVHFAKAGYNTTGIDLSLDMLKVASYKLKKHRIGAKLIQADMTRYKSNKKYDLIYSFNDSVNYLLTGKSMENFLYTAYDHLEDNGMLVFDASTEYNILHNFSGTIYEEFDNFYFIWRNNYDRHTRIILSELEFLLYDTLEVISEKHKQKIYTNDELLKQGCLCGFSQCNAYDGFTFKRPHKRSELVHFIMKK